MALPLIALKEAIKDQPSATSEPTAVVVPRIQDRTATPQTAQGEEQKTGYWWLWYNPFLWSPWWWYWGPRRA